MTRHAPSRRLSRCFDDSTQDATRCGPAIGREALTDTVVGDQRLGRFDAHGRMLVHLGNRTRAAIRSNDLWFAVVVFAPETTCGIADVFVAARSQIVR